MKILKKEVISNHAKLEIEVEHEEFKSEYNKVINEAASTVRIPGFRPGKAPLNIVEKNINQEFVNEKALEYIIEKNFAQIIKESGVEPIEMPRWSMISADKDGKCIFSFEADVVPEVKLGQYKGIKLKKNEVKVEEKDIDDYVKSVIEQGANIHEVSDRPAAIGDIVEIDISGSMDGVDIADLNRRSLPVLLGENRIAQGFDENIEGMNIGEHKKFALEMPADHPAKDFAGKKVDFNVNLIRIAQRDLPDFDDEFVKKISSFNSVKEYRENIRKKLEAMAGAKAEAEMKDSAIATVSSGAFVDIPQSLIRRESDMMIDEMDANLRGDNVTIEDYLRSKRTSLDALREEIRPMANSRAKAKLVLRNVAKAENLTVTEEELDKEIEQIAKDSGNPKEQYKNNGSILENIKDYKLRAKALDLIIENANIK